MRKRADGALEHDPKWAPVLTKNSHPCVKPIKLMAYLITMGSRQGNVILDPYMGSGTTGIVAQGLGRRFIGIEKDREYFKIAKARIRHFSTVFATIESTTATAVGGKNASH